MASGGRTTASAAIDRAFEIVVLDTAWAFWQYSALARVPERARRDCFHG